MELVFKKIPLVIDCFYMKRCQKLTVEQRGELQKIIENNERSAREIKRAQTVILIDAQTAPKIIMTLTGYNRVYAFRLRKHYLEQGIIAMRQ